MNDVKPQEKAIQPEKPQDQSKSIETAVPETIQTISQTPPQPQASPPANQTPSQATPPTPKKEALKQTVVEDIGENADKLTTLADEEEEEFIEEVEKTHDVK
jgi:hypothetical protein